MSLYYITNTLMYSVIIFVQFCMEGIFAGGGFSLFNHVVFVLKHACYVLVVHLQYNK